MDPLQSLHIVDLLREREAEFVRVWECEQEIQRILHGAFLFDPPPPLPSLAKPRRTRKVPAKAPLRLRRLRADEQAYRVHYEAQGETRTGLTANFAFLQDLIELDPPALRVTQVEAVHLDEAGTDPPGQLVWERETKPGTST
jgi:hypothetical protein